MTKSSKITKKKPYQLIINFTFLIKNPNYPINQTYFPELNLSLFIKLTKINIKVNKPKNITHSPILYNNILFGSFYKILYLTKINPSLKIVLVKKSLKSPKIHTLMISTLILPKIMILIAKIILSSSTIKKVLKEPKRPKLMIKHKNPKITIVKAY